MLQKKGKYWYVVINYKDGEKWKKKWIATGSESKREAKRQEKEIEYKAASGMTIYRPKKISLPSDNSWKNGSPLPSNRPPESRAHTRITKRCREFESLLGHQPESQYRSRCWLFS